VKGRKLLVASIGVATVSYVAAGSSIASCGGSGGQGGDAGGDAIQVVGNLAPACTQDSTVTCTPDTAIGISCPPGEDPTQQDTSIACTTAAPDAGTYAQYCCVQFSAGSGCTSEPSLSSVCTGAGAYPFRCTHGASPTAVDPGFQCAAPVADPSGLDDVCCTHP